MRTWLRVGGPSRSCTACGCVIIPHDFEQRRLGWVLVMCERGLGMPVLAAALTGRRPWWCDSLPGTVSSLGV